MQYWIFFEGGTGGDGFANLLEHSSTITPFDQNLFWRIQWYVDGLPKFWSPTPDINSCFRKFNKFDNQTNKLTDHYLHCVKNNIDTIVTSHDVTLDLLKDSDCWDVFTKNQYKILLKTNDFLKKTHGCVFKNMLEVDLERFNAILFHFSNQISEHDHLFDKVVYLESILDDWSAASALFDELNLKISQENYQKFCDLHAGRDLEYINNFPRFNSYIDENNVYRYRKID